MNRTQLKKKLVAEALAEADPYTWYDWYDYEWGDRHWPADYEFYLIHLEIMRKRKMTTMPPWKFDPEHYQGWQHLAACPDCRALLLLNISKGRVLLTEELAIRLPDMRQELARAVVQNLLNRM